MHNQIPGTWFLVEIRSERSGSSPCRDGARTRGCCWFGRSRYVSSISECSRLLLSLHAFCLQRIEDLNGERTAIQVFSLLKKKVFWEREALWSAKTQHVSSQNQEQCHGDIDWERAGLGGAELTASSWRQGLRPSEGRALCPVPPIPESLANGELCFVL